MRTWIKFISLYYVTCVLVLIVLYLLTGMFTMEIFSYLLWFYLIGLVCGIILYPLVKWVIKKILPRSEANLLIDALLCLLLLNFVSAVFGDIFLTAELIKNISRGFDREDNGLIVHAISTFSFVLSFYLVYKRKRQFRDT